MATLHARSPVVTIPVVAEPIDARESDLPKWARSEMQRLRSKLDAMNEQRSAAARARAESLSPERRRAIAKKGTRAAAAARAACTHEETFINSRGAKCCRRCRRKL